MSKADQRALVPTLKAGGKAMGIVPSSFDDCFRLAQCAAMSGTIPNGHDKTPEAVCMVIMFGLELGVPPMQAMQSITKINGKFCIYGDLVPALLWSHGFDIDQTITGDGESMEASCTITRPNGKKITRTFSVADAKVAQLWGKAGPWKNFPKRMLGWRALGFAKSDGASDIMRGMSIVELERDAAGAVEHSLPVLEVPDLPDETSQDTAAPEVNQDQPEPITNVAVYMANLEENLSLATDKEALDEIWEAHLELADRMGREDQSKAEALYEKAEKRIKKKGAT